jgi:hypothetical protein
MQIEYRESPGFQKDLKKLLKRFPTLREDLEVAKKAAIGLYHILALDNHAVFEIPGYGTDEVRFFKMKKFACRSLKNRGNQSGIRIIYAFRRAGSSVDFLEMYFKADQVDFSPSRLK